MIVALPYEIFSFCSLGMPHFPMFGPLNNQRQWARIMAMI